MSLAINKRSVMTVYSDTTDIDCHRVRIVLAEKGVTADILDVAQDSLHEDLAELNPYNKVPTVVDRDLVLYEPRVIMEYLDERFPHPPLMPVYPVARAKNRLIMYRIEQDWYQLVRKIETGSVELADQARKQLSESLSALAPVFADKTYFLSDEFTLVDCCVGPLLWRLPVLGVKIAGQTKAVSRYCDRVFEREAFQMSLSEIEREIRAA